VRREFQPVPDRDSDVGHRSPRRLGGRAMRATVLLTIAFLIEPVLPPIGAADPAPAAIEQDQDCPQCHGSGREACPQCHGEGKLYRPCRICTGTGQRPCLRCAGYTAKYGQGRVPCPACGGVARIWNDGAGTYGPCPTCRGSGGVVCSGCDGTAKVACPTHGFDRICPLCHLTGFTSCRRCRGTGVVSAEPAKPPESGSAPGPGREAPAAAAAGPPAAAPPRVDVPPQKPASDLFEELTATVAEIERQLGKGLSQEDVRTAIEELKQATGHVSDGPLAAQGQALLRRARELDAAIGAMAEMWRDARSVAERAIARYKDVRGMEGPAFAANDSSLRATLLSGIRRCDAVADALGERDLASKWTALHADMAGMREQAEQAIARAAEEKAAKGASAAASPPAAPPPAAAPPASPTSSPSLVKAERKPAPAPAAAPVEAPDPGADAEPAGGGRGGDPLTYLVIAVLLAVIAFETAAILRRMPGRRAVPASAGEAPTRAQRLGTGARFTKG